MSAGASIAVVIPSVDADYMASMEDVLGSYAQPYDPAAPLVYFDEKPGVLHGVTTFFLPFVPALL